MITLISKTTLPFCHEWQRVRVSSRHLIGRASISIIIIRNIIVITIIIIFILRIRSQGRRWWRVASGANSPMVAYRLAMRPTRTFTWYNSVESVSRQVSMPWSCTMMSPKDMSLIEEEGANVGWAKRDGVRWEGGVESYCCDLNCTSLRFTVAASMAHMKVKGLDAGERMEKWRKILVIA